MTVLRLKTYGEPDDCTSLHYDLGAQWSDTYLDYSVYDVIVPGDYGVVEKGIDLCTILLEAGVRKFTVEVVG